MSMSFIHCAGCTEQACSDKDECRIEAEKAAEERRKLLAAPPDRGITDIVAKITALLHMNGADLEKIQLVFLCDDLWAEGVVEQTLTKSIRNTDLLAWDRHDRVMGRDPTFRDGVRFMGLRIRVAAGKINGG